MFDFTIQSLAELGAILAIWIVCLAIGFSLYRSYELIRGERMLASRIRQARQSNIARLLESLASSQGEQECILAELEKEISSVATTLQKRELMSALRQPTDRGRRAYASKLLQSMHSDRALVA